MSEEALFEEFLERYCGSGQADIPADWPEALRDRCLFFVRMLESSQGGKIELPAGRSVVALLEESGAAAELTLPAPAGVLPPAPAKGGERYAIEREIARGGMGRVLLAYDRDFRRRVALKVMLGKMQESRRAARFVEEAQATAQLEHPNIAPVYDLGVDPSGSPYFTMKWIRGRDLAEVLRSGAQGFSLVRLVQVLQQAALGVCFAHSRGVVHRDLKPQNVMVGDYGEVLVVDWGLAKVLRRPGEGAVPGREALVSTERAERGEVTLEGSVHGSPAYMSPEQARGDAAEIDERTDVFGLGAILYEILTGSPPYGESSVQAALGRARRGDLRPPREAAPGRTIPDALDAACRRALSPRKEDRFQKALELHDALQAFIEGIHDAERRAAEATRLREAADALRADLRRAEAEEAAAHRHSDHVRATLADHDTEEQKRPLWEASARAGAAREEAQAAFVRAAAAYLAVLSIDPSDAQARAALASLYRERLLAAEERCDREAASLYQGLVAQYDDGRHRIELEGRTPIKLESDPRGAGVLLARYEERGPLLIETGHEPVGETPLERRLPRGSYLAVLRKPGFSEVRYPFLLGRGGAHEARVRLHREGSIPEGFVQVPRGESIVGGDAREFRALARRRVLVEELFAAVFPVTIGEYCAFLDEAVAGEPPGLEDPLPLYGSERYVERDADGRFVPIAKLGPRVPVIALLVGACDAYCRWLGRRLGKRVRLLEEVEWERCARGADGRIYPWGNGFDWAFCKGRSSRKGEPFPEPVGAFPRDVSPFGVRDLAGGVRELCAGTYGDGYQPLRGGSWFNPYPFVFRADCRTTRGELTRTTDAGLRVCYDERST
ncbi:MAG: protein kinase [Planctomycetes bacterium]|nr:protein kinase [Planctomycetota bacterium]